MFRREKNRRKNHFINKVKETVIPTCPTIYFLESNYFEMKLYQQTIP